MKGYCVMSQLQSDKYNIAWFKLAEFVSRKEKERALGIYKLLVHSLPTDAIAAQLEGDLLLAFHDEKALQSYTRAVELYERTEDYVKALAVCEHCLTLVPDSIYHIERSIRLYIMIGDKNKACQYADRLGKMLAIKQNTERNAFLITDHTIDHDCRLHIAHSFVIESLNHNPSLFALVEKPLTFVLQSYAAESSKKLNSFLVTLESIDQATFSWATKYIKNDDFEKMDGKK